MGVLRVLGYVTSVTNDLLHMKIVSVMKCVEQNQVQMKLAEDVQNEK